MYSIGHSPYCGNIVQYWNFASARFVQENIVRSSQIINDCPKITLAINKQKYSSNDESITITEFL